MNYPFKVKVYLTYQQSAPLLADQPIRRTQKTVIIFKHSQIAVFRLKLNFIYCLLNWTCLTRDSLCFTSLMMSFMTTAPNSGLCELANYKTQSQQTKQLYFTVFDYLHCFYRSAISFTLRGQLNGLVRMLWETTSML